MLLPRVMCTLNSGRSSIKGAVAPYECVFNRPFWDDTLIRSEVLKRSREMNSLEDNMKCYTCTSIDEPIESSSCSSNSVLDTCNESDLAAIRPISTTSTITQVKKCHLIQIRINCH